MGNVSNKVILSHEKFALHAKRKKNKERSNFLAKRDTIVQLQNHLRFS